MKKINRPLVKTSDWPWPIGDMKPLFPELRKAVTSPTPGSPEALAATAHDDKIKNQSIMAALRMAGIGILAGGGTRLLQEGYDRFLRKPEGGAPEEDITIDIHRPRDKTKRRGKLEKKALKSVKDWGLHYPLAVAGTGLGLYGGYQGVRGIAEWLKKREAESEVAAAKQEFEDALDEQFAASRVKTSALHKAIDSSYEKWLASNEGLTKEASLPGKLVGFGVGTAALIWLLSHSAAYSRMKKSDPEAFRKKVLLRQRRMRQAASPPPIVFEFPGDEEEEEIKKVAAEVLPGGRAEGKDTGDIAKNHGVPKEQIDEQVEKGTEVEMEHTDNPAVAKEISEDHEVEDPKYYDPHLERMEEEAQMELQLAGPQEDALGDPDTADIAAILKKILVSPNLDDSAMHEQFMRLGVSPHEGEERVYSALQGAMRQHPGEVNPAEVKEQEVEDEAEEDGGEADSGEQEKAAAAAEHSCGMCEYFNGGVCAEQKKVMEEVGEDNLTIYQSNPTKTNSCPVFEEEAGPTEETGELIVSDAVKEALLGEIAQGAKDIWNKGKSFVEGAAEGAAMNIPGMEQQLVQSAKVSANDPKTLAPAAQEIATNPHVQSGMNEAAMQKVQGIPLLGSMFGS